MLSAEHLALQSRLVQQLVAVRQKEMDYMLQRYQSIGTQAALICGFSISSLTGLTPSAPDVAPAVSHLFYISTFVCILTEMHVILTTLFVCNWAPGLALRGPTGSMSRAFDATRGERMQVSMSFCIGIFAFGVQTVLAVWILDNKVGATSNSLIATSLMGLAAVGSIAYTMRCALHPWIASCARAHRCRRARPQDASTLFRSARLQEFQPAQAALRAVGGLRPAVG